MKSTHPGYRAANLDLCNAIGLNAELCKTLNRATARKDCPVWLIKSLSESIDRSNLCIAVMRRRCDGMPKYLEEQSK